MRGLLWKEWRQNRMIVVWMALLTLVILIGDILLNIANQPRQRHVIVAGEVEGILYFIWFLSALFCSSTTIASEIGSGSLQFLSGLPISRKRLWLTKLLTCLLLLALSVAASTVVYFGVYAVASHSGAMQSSFDMSVRDFSQDAPAMLSITLPLCAFGMLVTVLMDRTISALMTGIIASVALFVLLLVLVTVPGTPWTNNDAAWWLFGGLCVPVFLNVSYDTFRYGETLRTSTRFKIAVPSFFLSVGIIAVVLAISYFWIVS